MNGLYNLLFKLDIILPFFQELIIYILLLYVVDCCWALVAIECLVATIKVKHPNQRLLILSTQQLSDECMPNETRVYGYTVDAALLYIEENDILEKHNYIDGCFTGGKKKKKKKPIELTND